jgi:GT2 family glycosyltransferase/tetratricopeptide (TPR) repeat protein
MSWGSNGSGIARTRRLRWALRRADRARDQREYAKAARLYQNALALDPRRADTRLQLGQMFKELARFGEAEAAFRQVLGQSPNNREAQLQLAQLLSLLGRGDEQTATPQSERLRPDSPRLPSENSSIGVSAPVGGGSSSDTRIDHHRREGDQLRDARQFSAAADAYARTLQLAPERTDLRIQYGNMLKDAGRMAEAEAAYREAIAERPDDPEVHLQLGHALKLQGKRAEALEAYRRAALAQPPLLAPRRELFHAGDGEVQRDLFERQLALGGVEALLTLSEEIVRLQGVLNRLIEGLPDPQALMAFPVSSYDRYRRMYDVPPAPAASRPCRFAVVVAAHRVAVATLYDQIASLTAQTHGEWQLWILGSGSDQRVAVERAAASDARIRWIPSSADEPAAAAERRIALLLGVDWLVFPGRGVLLHPQALAWFAAVAERGAARVYIADGETISREYGEMRRTAVALRQVVDYDTLLEANPFGDTVAIRSDAYAEIAADLVIDSISAARTSLLLNVAARETVGHIPLPLTARSAEVDPRAAAEEAHEAAVRAHLDSAGISCRVRVEPPTGPGLPLTIRWQPDDPVQEIVAIIPTRDNGEDLIACVESLRRCADRPEALRLLIVDNGSRDPDTRDCFARLAREAWATVVRLDEPFNWSRLNNHAAALTDAPLLLFANDDMLMLSPGWDRRLRGLLERPEIGAIGARLIYPDESLQHGGIALGWAGTDIHDGRYEPIGNPGPGSRWHVSRAVSAVTGAFLATRRDTFEAVGGFDEAAFPVAYGDIDYALKLRERGLKILWTPGITLRHYESKTRGLDHLDPEKAARYAAERRCIEERWGAALQVDPSINPTWHQATLPFRLLSMPSSERLWRHIKLCAAEDPWFPDCERTGDRASRDRIATGTGGD